jgi:hypothetical protein
VDVSVTIRYGEVSLALSKLHLQFFFGGFERLSLGFDDSSSILDSRSLSMWKGNQYRACLVILISKVELSDRFRFRN